MGTSELIKAKIKKDGGFDKNSDNITAEGFYKVMSYAKDKAKETLDDYGCGRNPRAPRDPRQYTRSAPTVTLPPSAKRI